MLTLDTQPEADNFNILANSNLHLFGEYEYIHVGAMAETFSTTSDWYWNNGKRVSIELRFLPGEPNNNGGFERCLCVNKNMRYNDVHCYGAYKRNFICQKTNADQNIDKSSFVNFSSM